MSAQDRESDLSDLLRDCMMEDEEDVNRQSQIGVVRQRSPTQDIELEEDAPAPQRPRVDLQRHHWFLTWNNPPRGWVDILKALGAEKYVFQKEVAPSTGMIHIQGVFSFKHSKRWSILDNALVPKGAWAPCKNRFAAANYCSKKDSSLGELHSKGYRVIRPVKDPLEGKTLYAYQHEIIELVLDEPDERLVYWYHSRKGNVGKSSLCKHLCMKHNALILGGRTQDAYYGIANRLKMAKDIPLIVFDIPRSKGNDITYEAIEGIKNGCFFSSKYESDMCLFNAPHLIVFSNYAPDQSQLSSDRWIVKCLDDEEDLKDL